MLIKKHVILIIVLTSLLSLIVIVAFMEHSYRSCRPRIAKIYLNTMTSFSCYELKKSVITLEASPYADYSNVFKVERYKIGNNHGVACNDIAFVATDLPKRAQKYVAYHEYLHTQGDDSETLVNIKSGIRNPLGLLQTISTSLRTAVITKGFNKCSLASLWKVFKVYFLMDSFKDLILH